MTQTTEYGDTGDIILVVDTFTQEVFVFVFTSYHIDPVVQNYSVTVQL